MSDEQKTPTNQTDALREPLRRTQFVRIREDYPSAIVSEKPVGDVSFMGHEFTVKSCTIQDMADLRDHYGKSPISGEWNLGADGTLEEMAYAAWVAFGGEACPITVEQMMRMPWAFEAVMREALTVFFWVGPLMASSTEPTSSSPTDAPESTPEAESGTPDAGTKETQPVTS